MTSPDLLLLVTFAVIGSTIKADKSPNPAAISYSGCSLKQTLSCNSHSDSDIQMGECWSNARVMQQQSAFFVPYPPGHKSYDSEGGPYGDCTAYACFPTPNDMQEESNLASFYFFWDGKDHTTLSNGGLQRRELTENGQDSRATADPNQNTTTTIDPTTNTANDPKHSTNATDPNICTAPNPNTKPTTEPSLDPTLKDGTKSDTKSKKSYKYKPIKAKHMKKTKKIRSEKKSPSSSYNSDKDYSNNSTSKASGSDSDSDSGSQSSTNSSMPTAPGQAVIPIPMICPSNLPDCYSADYFEEGGKLQVYANVVPTYQGLWFPPKNKNHEYTFCKGLDLGCSAPTMRNLQSKNIGNQDCDISKCKVPANST